MKVSMLASGSSGNVTYIETPQAKILVDAGLSGKKIEGLMSKINRNLSDVTHLLVTHEHVDHIQGVGVLARKYGMSIYANEKTWSVMDTMIGKIPTEQKIIFPMGKTLTIADIDVFSFGVSHDAIAPQFYAFRKDNKQFAMLTDTGYVSERIKKEIENADVYLMESNHDVDLLRAGSYPWSTKQRILGDKGHLSNVDGALAISEMIGHATKKIYLGHLSKENNLKPLANSTFEQILQSKNLGVNIDFYLYDTDPNEPTNLIVI